MISTLPQCGGSFLANIGGQNKFPTPGKTTWIPNKEVDVKNVFIGSGQKIRTFIEALLKTMVDHTYYTQDILQDKRNVSNKDIFRSANTMDGNKTRKRKNSQEMWAGCFKRTAPDQTPIYLNPNFEWYPHNIIKNEDPYDVLEEDINAKQNVQPSKKQLNIKRGSCLVVFTLSIVSNRRCVIKNVHINNYIDENKLSLINKLLKKFHLIMLEVPNDSSSFEQWEIEIDVDKFSRNCDGQNGMVVKPRADTTGALLVEMRMKYRATQTNSRELTIHAAVNTGDRRQVAYLLDEEEEEATVERCDESGITPLQQAITQGDADMVHFLVSKGTKFRLHNGDRPLPLAIASGQSKTVKVLLNNGEKVEDEDLAKAARYGRVDTCELLHEWTSPERSIKVFTRAGAASGQAAVVNLADKWRAGLDGDPGEQQEPSRHYIERQYRRVLVRLMEELEAIKDPRLLQHTVRTNVCFIHYQDDEGLTPLHKAAQAGNVALVVALLDCGAYPLALTHALLTPQHLAMREGHGEVATIIGSRIAGHNRIQPGSHDASRHYDTLLTLIARAATTPDNTTQVEVVQGVSRLLVEGAPLEHPGHHVSTAVHLAVTTNSTLTLPLLLAAGAPLTSSVGGVGLLRVAKLSRGVTPWVAVVVARAMEHALLRDVEELGEGEEELEEAVKEVVEAVRGEAPWEARMRCCEGDEVKARRLVARACQRGAVVSAWWLCQAVAGMQDAIQHALNATHTPARHLVLGLVNHLGVNPYTPDQDATPFLHRLPQPLQDQLITEAVEKEHGVLVEKMARMDRRNNHKAVRNLTAQVGLLLALFTLYRRRQDGEGGEEFRRMIGEVGVKGNVGGGEALVDGNWVTEFASEGDFWSDLNLANGSFAEVLPVDGVTLKKAVKVCCELNLAAFLFLLVRVAGVDVGQSIDDICGGSALHLAATHGHLSLAVFLVMSGASKTLKDRNGNTPSHCAFMVGQREVAKFLADGIEGERNALGFTAEEMKDKYDNYLTLQAMHGAINAGDHTDVPTLIQQHLTHRYKEWKIPEDIIDTIDRFKVDYSKGEAKDVREGVRDFVRDVTRQVAMICPTFKGELELLGSCSEDVRLFCPDEYDFNLILEKDVDVQVIDAPKNAFPHKRVIVISKNGDRDLDNLNDLFYDVMKDVLKNTNMTENLRLITPAIKKTQVGVNLCLSWTGNEFPLLLVDVDIVPTVKASWPSNHPRPPLTPPSLHSVYLNQLADGEWRFSFGLAEGMIMRKLTSVQRRVFLGCKLLTTALKAVWWAPVDVKKSFTHWDNKAFRIQTPASFALKSAFLEELQQGHHWRQDRILDHMASVFSRMCVTEHKYSNNVPASTKHPRHVPAYFGGETQLPSFANNAPDILTFLQELAIKCNSP